MHLLGGLPWRWRISCLLCITFHHTLMFPMSSLNIGTSVENFLVRFVRMEFTQFKSLKNGHYKPSRVAMFIAAARKNKIK